VSPVLPFLWYPALSYNNQSYNPRPTWYTEILRTILDKKTLRGLRGPEYWREETISKKKRLKARRSDDPSNGAVTVAGARAKPTARVRDYESHVFVCTGGDCKKRGAKDMRKALKEELRSEGLLSEVRLDAVDCLGLCKHGPNVVVYDRAQPKGTWYLGLLEEDVPEVVERHLKSGEPVERLAADRCPPKAKKK
jgi:(2Fe-2S) ferredoxin